MVSEDTTPASSSRQPPFSESPGKHEGLSPRCHVWSGIPLMLLLIAGLVRAGAAAEEADGQRWPVSRGHYLGQTFPGLRPQPFVPGFISTDVQEAGSASSLDATVFLFNRFRL